MKWPLAMRTASLPDERWATKEAEWNPGLSIKHKTWRLVGRPRKRWEDEINDFLKPEETEATKGNEIKNNDTWIKAAENRERWKEMENEYAIAASHTKEPTLLAEQASHQGAGLTLIGKAYRRSTMSLPCLQSKACTKAFLENQRKRSPEGLMSANHLDTTICHAFHRNLSLVLNRIQEFHSFVDPVFTPTFSSCSGVSVRSLLFFNSDEFVTAHACWFFFPHDSAHCL